MEDERFLTSALKRRDESYETSLRPQTFDDFPGQEVKKEQLCIYVQAAKDRGDALGHLLLSGPPGLGKTTLAHIVANVRGKAIKTSSGPVVEKPGDLAGLLTGLEEGDILFIDEIHRLNTTVEEYLYSAMEDFYIDIILDQGAGSRSIRLDLPHFTLIGATTRQGSISSPLLSRFQMKVRLDYYTAPVLQQIVVRSAGILGVEVEEDGAAEIARRSRGTPRIANNLLRWVRDFSQVKGDGRVTREMASQALAMLEIDQDGLDEMDNRYLHALIFRFDGGPVGVKNMAVALGEEAGTLEDVYEPFLIQEGYVFRTSQGRVATAKTFKRLGVAPKTNARSLRKDGPQPELFDGA